MLAIVKGMMLLLLVLIVFSGFSLKAPKGDKAMSGLAGAAVATFLVEAIHKYISGDFLHFEFLGEVGNASGSMGGPIAAIYVCINMGVNPVYAMVAGAATAKLGILPGFMAGYLVGLFAPKLEEKLPKGVDIIIGALTIAPIARLIAVLFTPIVNSTLLSIGDIIRVAADQSPYIMGFLLGGIIKILCTSPLSSMALTAMLGLQGLAMGIAAISSFGGAFTNGVVFKRLNIGDSKNVISVMLEPLTQADIITKNPFPIYFSDFIGGGLAGIAAAHFKIINNAPGTASPIPGLLAPFGFNPPLKVLLALGFAMIGGLIGGYVGTTVIKYMKNRKMKIARVRNL
ncbi:PTS sugar transporter subunit IIC [Abyssisolibacter fermentans]|uniref:PTS sugar transporter subunit IIC n=1 Tax=Abyssisolibacter fermentans TaxID=1766203 RepID=UPI0008372146|nr:PTS sugar transporter subunit IIC [Abyssisolibacter fermentans]